MKKKEKRVFINIEKGFPEETCRQLVIGKVRGIGKVKFLNGWIRKI